MVKGSLQVNTIMNRITFRRKSQIFDAFHMEIDNGIVRCSELICGIKGVKGNARLRLISVLAEISICHAHRDIRVWA